MNPEFNEMAILNRARSGVCMLSEPIIGYKKVFVNTGNDYNGYAVLAIRIPIGATIVRPYNSRLNPSKQLRASRAYVERKEFSENSIMSNSKYVSIYDPEFIYTVGEFVEPDSFDKHINVKHAPGIYFFLNFTEAQDYFP